MWGGGKSSEMVTSCIEKLNVFLVIKELVYSKNRLAISKTTTEFFHFPLTHLINSLVSFFLGGVTVQ